MKKNILVVLGTRPEAVKLAPVILALKSNANFRVTVCNTEQQKELSNQTLAFFNLEADISLDIMKQNQSLVELQSRLLLRLSEVLANGKYDATIVQGDTMTVLCGALASFYHKVPVFHVEAGLRSYNLFEPFPEEAIRQMVGRIADLHFAPTERAVQCLLKEGIVAEKIVCTGNTVIDALVKYLPFDMLKSAESKLQNLGLDLTKKIVLITVHRRENHGERLLQILKAVKSLALEYPETQFVVPVHPNPNVKITVSNELSGTSNIHLTDPLDYPELVFLMKLSCLILTDSGGIQEEATAFGVPILVLRYKTERMEGVEAGFAKLVGADFDLITQSSREALSKEFLGNQMPKNNPYGDGLASERILECLLRYFHK